MNFIKYVEASDTWVDSHYIMGTATDTITTLPAVLYPNAVTATVGLKGNTVQNGTPSPQNPVMPNGTGDMSSNLVESYLSGCNIDASGKLISNASYNMFYAKVEQGKTYCLDSTATVGGFYENLPTIGSISYDGQRISFSLSAFTAPIDGYLAYRKASSETTAMMNEGNELLPYSPYGYKIPISSASTTTNVYLGEVQSTRNIQKLVLTGEEDITSTHLNVGLFNIPVAGYLRLLNQVTCICSHYIGAANVGGWSAVNDKTACFYAYTGTLEILYIRDSTYSTIADFKAYLQQQYTNGTPVTVYYVLATETTGIVNEPLMKIGDYADTLSNVSIPVTAGGDTISVDTTVQPSEVTATYKGWHPVANVHERESGQWD